MGGSRPASSTGSGERFAGRYSEQQVPGARSGRSGATLLSESAVHDRNCEKGGSGAMPRNIYKGRVVNLNLETVTLPNGTTVELEIIHHSGASAVVPMSDDKTVLLIRQYRHAVGGYILEIPAGRLDPGEDPRDCAMRELEEEIGYRAAFLDHLLSFFTTPGFTDEIIHIYKATGLTRGRQNLEGDEVLDVVEMPLEKAMTRIEDGTIRDGKTIVGLQAVYLRART